MALYQKHPERALDKEAIETLAAFANTKGGTIVIGVQNSGKLCDVQLGKETLQNWTNQIKLNTAPSIAPDVSINGVGFIFGQTVSTFLWWAEPTLRKAHLFSKLSF